MTTPPTITTSSKVRKPRKPTLAELAQVPETLKAAIPERALCQACGLFKTCRTPFMRPFVPRGWTRRLLLVGEAPGQDEDEESGRPFTGRSGQLLRRLYHQAGYADVDVAITNSVICRPTRNAKPTVSQIRSCRPFLLRVINVLQPRRIVGLGVVAATALQNRGGDSVTSLRGRVLAIPGIEYAGTCYVTYHPSAVIRGASHLESRIVDDLRRDTLPVLQPPADEPPPLPTRVLGIDLEWDKGGELLTAAVADTTRAAAFDVED